MSRFTAIDLFAGIGGFRTAVEANDGRCIGFSEIEPSAIDVYLKNYNSSEEENYGDITKIKALPPHDLLTAGVPCQSWSIAGKNLGFKDDRGKLWNDAIYLLNQSKPKAFIFENVKGLVDPRNKDAFQYILERIKDAGYYANYYILNSSDYGVPQSRVRVYIIGFKDKEYQNCFELPTKVETPILEHFLDDKCVHLKVDSPNKEKLKSYSHLPKTGCTSLSSNQNGYNDYFLFNDIRNGSTTLHTWDILDCSEREREICTLLLKNRRKSEYGPLDGNPLSLKQLQELDRSITQTDVDNLTSRGIFKVEPYKYRVVGTVNNLSSDELQLLSYANDGFLTPDYLLSLKDVRTSISGISNIIHALVERGVLECVEYRYDFKYTKISTGLFGVNRIFLPSSSFFPTLVASDSNDYVTNIGIDCDNITLYRNVFIEEVYKKNNYRKITKKEACRIQGFPDTFILPDNRSKWMKLLGNSVSVPLIKLLVQSICNTGVFENKAHPCTAKKANDTSISNAHKAPVQLRLFL